MSNVKNAIFFFATLIGILLIGILLKGILLSGVISVALR
jgi:hypothetical protein